MYCSFNGIYFYNLIIKLRVKFVFIMNKEEF